MPVVFYHSVTHGVGLLICEIKKFIIQCMAELVRNKIGSLKKVSCQNVVMRAANVERSRNNVGKLRYI